MLIWFLSLGVSYNSTFRNPLETHDLAFAKEVNTYALSKVLHFLSLALVVVNIGCHGEDIY